MSDASTLSRRDLLRAGAAGAVLVLGNTLPVWPAGDAARLPRRVLGKTGVEVPILPRRVMVFKPSNVLKAKINGRNGAHEKDE